MKKELVVPNGLRQQVMSVNQKYAFSGHLGAKKTEVRILPNFFWPGLRQNINRSCHFCDVCQRKVKKGIVKKVPLGAMPQIDTPSKSVAVDIIGPIAPPSEAGHRYILILVNYATRYPEVSRRSRRSLLKLNLRLYLTSTVEWVFLKKC